MVHGIEAVLLTGGASRRMGTDKAKLPVDGEPAAARIARLLRDHGVHVTTCGREAVTGFPFQKDEQEFAGPLVALARFNPAEPLIFVASCDLIGFHPAIVDLLLPAAEGHDAAVPAYNGRLQPLCAIYRSAAFTIARELVQAGECRVMAWLDCLDVIEVHEIETAWIRNVNTMEEFLQP